ncbi:MAG: alpha/beta hydrolase [Candidatus Lokiarchaeota archaeon]|nr:alpha/beta hydrolase [Candidatus Harpocratesius repetitus]
MYLNIKGVDIYYEIHGNGIPILNLHGFPLDHRIMLGCMEPIFDENLNTKYKRIYFDFPGMGKSTSASWIKSTDDILQLTLDFISEIIHSESFIVVGESYGGYIAGGVVSRLRNRILGLLLICPMIIADFSKRHLPKRTVLERDFDFYSKFPPKLQEEYDSILVIENERICTRYQQEIPDAMACANMELLNQIQQKAYGFSWNILDISDPFSFPTLFILGCQDDIVGYQDALEFSANFSRASVAILDKAGHYAQVEQQEIFEKLVIEWLNRIK